MPAALDEAP